jgi:SAM-dependent methyltransferase
MRCEHAAELPHGRLHSPSAKRNKGPILTVLERVLPRSGLVLEIASGTGQHVVHFARALTELSWQPSDPDANCRRSISAWLAIENLANIGQPLDLDVCTRPWPSPAPDAIVCINLIHIAPWAATTSLFSGAKVALRTGGVIYLYGPYARQGRHTAASNEAFDTALRAQNPDWGVRNLEDVARVANEEGFDLLETTQMPANNFSVAFQKREATRQR